MLAYVKAHGGGTIAVSSQSSAAASIIASGADVAGIGGFSGRESDVSAAGSRRRCASGTIRWVLDEQAGARAASPAGAAGRHARGLQAAMAAVAKACRKVTLPASAATSSRRRRRGAGAAAGSGRATLYDCQGRAGAIARA